MSVTFSLAATTLIRLEWSMLFFRTSGNVRILPMLDGAVALQPTGNANYYGISQGENSFLSSERRNHAVSRGGNTYADTELR
jgi:hypothetical protein